jgi:hypothetical protein
MTAFVAMIIGWVFGARSGRKDLDRIGKSLKALYGTDEFAEVVTAMRVQIAETLRSAAAMIDESHTEAEPGSDLVAHVRHLVHRD